MRFFNTEGPVDSSRHYCLPPLERLDLDEVLLLIQQHKYFVLHAPRQTGKTTCLLALAEHLNRAGHFRAVYANLEVAQAYREDVDKGMPAVVEQIARGARDQVNDEQAIALSREVLQSSSGGTAVTEFLSRWCRQQQQPLVLLLDEVDALVGDTLISLLRQLRAGYPARPHAFPQTVVLCGVRDLQDYRIQASSQTAAITGGSAFNIKAESLRLGDFQQPETTALLLQHTHETGQPFAEQALALVWELTLGQPWLVNALGYTACFRSPAGRDRTRQIMAEQIHAAREWLVLHRVTHLDQLADKLREPRVRRVVEPILGGTDLEQAATPDDVSYVVDLGLVCLGPAGPQIANPIYREVIPRELTQIPQMNLEAQQQSAWYVGPDGRLQLARLLSAFQQFFREHAESWVERLDYKEAGPQLLLQAFLQRIVNGGGRVEREYGLGRGRTDLLVTWAVDNGNPLRETPGTRNGGAGFPPALAGPVQRAVIELKVLRGAPATTLADGLAQTWEYADRCRADEAHLVVFDRRPGRPWEERIWVRQEQYRGRVIGVWGM